MGEGRKPSVKKAQLEYQRRQRAKGGHVQINLTLKTEGDRAMFRELQRRYPDDSSSSIARRGLKALYEIRYEEGVFEFKPRPGRKAKGEGENDGS